MSAGSAVLVVETHADGRLVLGPLLYADQMECLQCLQQRRQESGLALGRFSTRVLDAQALKRLGHSRLWEGQLCPDSGLHRLVCVQSSGCTAAAGRLLALADVVGPRLGLITDVSSLQDGLPDLTTCVARGAPGQRGSAGVALHASGTATDTDPQRAWNKAVWEALEHMAAGYWPTNALCEHPPAQEPVLGHGPWVAAQAVETGHRVWVPAAWVYMPFPAGPEHWAGDTRGLACGDSLADARERAVCEWVERGVLDQLWPLLEASVPCPKRPRSTRSLVWEGVLGQGLGRSVAMCLSASAEGPPWGWMGFGAAADPSIALAKARQENQHVRAHMTAFVRHRSGPPPVLGSPMDRRMHALTWQAGLANAWIQRLQRQGPALPLPELLVPAGLAWRDLTPSSWSGLGLRVVRVVGLQTASC